MSRPRRRPPETELELPASGPSPLSEADFDLYPGYVSSADEKTRWDLCKSIAEEVSKQNEPSGVADATFVIWTTRALYRSDIETGSPGDS